MEILTVLFKSFWCGCAAIGFAILFNVPPRSLPAIWIGGATAGLVKFGVLMLSGGVKIVLGSFLASLAVGILSIPIAHLNHVPPMIFAIPSVIPMVPGAFAYRTMLGLMKLAGPMTADYGMIAAETTQNALRTMFILIAIALGAAVPMHLMRKNSVKHIRLLR